MFHGLRGPNVTVSNKYFAGETALIQAASLLRHGQADIAIVLAGDALAQTLYSWYDVAGLLSPACYNSEPLSEAGGFIPSEGVAALVMELSGGEAIRSDARSYARIRSGRWAAGGQPAETIRPMLGGTKLDGTMPDGATLGGSVPSLIICSGNGSPCATSPTTALARAISNNGDGAGAGIILPQPFALGLAGTGALFHLILGLSSKPSSRPNQEQALLLATAADSGFAALLLELLQT
jgi:hypothetical protein